MVMNRLAFNKAFGMLLLLVLCTTAIFANGDEAREYTKEIKREYNIDKYGTIQVRNKYGEVAIKTWDKDRVKVDVLIKVDASKESDAVEIFNMIEVVFKSAPDFVMAETIINTKSKNYFWNNPSQKSKYTINYEVFMPATANLNLANKYGDVYCEYLSGGCDVNLKYCSFKMDGFKKDSRMDLAYSNGYMKKLNDAELYFKYGQCEIQEVGDLLIESKYATVSIENADAVKSYSAYDNYRIGKVDYFENSGKFDNIHVQQAGDMEISSKYANIQANVVDRFLDMELNYSEVQIDEMSRHFKGLNAMGSHTQFNIGIDESAEYILDASADYAGLVYPQAVNVKQNFEKSSSKTVKGIKGASENAPVIKVRIKYGAFKLK